MEGIPTTKRATTGSLKSESEIEFLVNRKKNVISLKARYHWSLLRNSIRITVDSISETDSKDVVVTHGIHHVRKMNHPHCVQQVAMINTRQEYITTDGRGFRIFLEDGRRKANIIPEETMDRVIYSSQTDQYVGWQHKTDQLYLMEKDELEIISQVRTPDKVFLATYNSNTGEVLTVGPNFIMTIAFRYAARHLIPNKTIKTEFGEDNMFNMMVLEDTASQSQRLYLAIDSGVVVFNIHHGKMLLHKKDLHVRSITALTFFNPLKYVVTGALDGSIKVWDEKWHIVMVFVGHCEKVNALAVYPNGPAVISASTDHTIRVWNLETCDEVDRVAIAEPVDGLGTEQQYNIFYTFSGRKVDLWQLQHLYNIHTAIGHRVNKVKITTHPFFPVRAVLSCSDSSVRIVSPGNGNVITSLIMEQFSGLVDAAYAIAEETLFTVMGNGDIVKSLTNTNPCKVVNRWKNFQPGEICNYLLVYEYIVDVMVEGDIWEAMKRGATTQSLKTLSHPPKNQNRNRTLLLGGRRDGYICVYNWLTGDVDFKIEAHGSKGVLNLLANSKEDQLISAGMDNVIKIWRLYPFAEEALTPLMSFYCAHTPAHMSTIKSTLCVTFQDPTTATFSTVLYNLQDKMFGNETQNLDAFHNRFDHKPDDDHVDVITGLTVCRRMKLFASASIDGTIRIWNETNTLVRLLKLNVIPYSISFYNSKGDLLVGIGRHLFKIPYESYMPRAYKCKMVTMKFLEQKAEKPLEYDSNLINMMSKNDVKRLKNSRSSFKFDTYVDVLTPEEEESVNKEKAEKEKAFSVLFTRDDELKQLKKGDVKPRKKKFASQQTKDEAFKNYMKMFYDKPKITLPEDDLFPLDTVNDRLAASPDGDNDSYKPEAGPTGFFPDNLPPKSILKPSKPCAMPQRIVPGGFIPNSVLAKILYPTPRTPDSDQSSEYRPPSLTLDQLQQIGEFGIDTTDKNSPHRTVKFHRNDDHSNRVFDMEDYVEDNQSQRSSLPKTPSPTPSNKSEEDAFWGKPKPPPEQLPTNKFQGLLNQTPTPEPKQEEKEEEEEEIPVRVQKSPPKPIAKLISRPPITPPKRRAPTVIPTPSPPAVVSVRTIPTPASPRPITPLPDFITQFTDTEWFKQYFPSCSDTTWPKPWTADAFALSLLKVLRSTEFPNKTAISEALILLNVQEGFSDFTCQTAARTIISVLNDKKHVPISAVDLEKNFILTAIRALNCLSIKDKDFITELIIQYLDGDREVRSLVCDILINCGLQDSHRQLEKELDSWDIWNLEEEDRKTDLRVMCHQWLDRWMTSYKLHIEDTLERMKKGQNIHGRITKSQLQKHQTKAKKKGSAVSILDDQGTVTTLPDGTEFIPRPSEVDKTSQRSPSSSSRSITLMYNKLPDGNLTESASYIDVVNYFCEMMVEKEIESIKRGHSAHPVTKTTEKIQQNKNTVLVLPRLPRY
ncbi:WD repeat-containing protein 97 [Patella vulgata]|uniref:WD repeat-containing protein 97 n=1 Tax=Patella vulgata TaxID=6465 RepID=UPI0024A9BDDB|nr:WD repeat-containing protein 97 [Patella vulgata]